ncbi:hypothetical protein H257_08448 [Aphanomyces astaci]|uniref:FYVE-type domain-containing protein n=1 Tax=Aphanomyces astaci TaxID=112090 RepID=W4GEL7_APHAT|nr:hypothetical protein H257_08448 [Aphanomyces astaci]ETV77509.1 hypothetical protein H257_08448 [Aphanomyces astaci]|eukprot:XP_009832619.1 hypothetical protein H257_08448 [Aphanomyces astaci]
MCARSCQSACLMRHMHFVNEEDLAGDVDVLDGIPVDAWKPDPKCDRCNACVKKFRLFYRRRHHCRVCGELYCSECLQLRYVRVPWLGVALTLVCMWCDQKATTSHRLKSSCLRPLPPPSSLGISSLEGQNPLPSKTQCSTHGLHIGLSRSTTQRPLPAAISSPAIPPSLMSTRSVAHMLPRHHRSTTAQLDRSLNVLCSTMHCAYGAIVITAGSSFKVLTQHGRSVVTTSAFSFEEFLIENATTVTRPWCWNATADFLFCGIAPLLDKATTAIAGYVVVLGRQPRNPAILDALRRILHQHALQITDQLNQPPELSRKLISLRAGCSNQAAISPLWGGQWIC